MQKVWCVLVDVPSRVMCGWCCVYERSFDVSMHKIWTLYCTSV